MQSKSVLAALALMPLACSSGGGSTASGGMAGTSGSGASSGEVSGMGGAPGDERLSVPDGLPNTTREGDEPGGLTLVAFSLVQGATGAELYAAVKNDGQTPSCEAGMQTDFFDQAGQLVTSAGTVLLSQQFYQLGTGVIIPCIDPGQIAMGASTDLPESIVVAELGSLQHAFPAFTVDGIVPIAGLTISDVNSVMTAAGSAYTGGLSNGFGVTVSAATATIFPLNRVGRPLGAAISSATADIPAGGSWAFQTGAVNVLGVDYAAYPSASIPN